MVAAAAHGHVRFLEHFASEGAPLTEANEEGQTPFAAAGMNGHVAVVQHLVQRLQGSKGSKSSPARWPALAKKLHSRNTCAIREIVSGGTAAVPVVKYLIGLGADVNEVCADGTLLDSATTSAGDEGIGMLRFLLEAGAGPVTGRHLAAAAMPGHLHKVQYIASFLSKSQMSDWGSNALPTAAREGHRQIVDLLLGLKADVKRYDPSGLTALHLAVRTGRPSLIQKLVESGADPQAESELGTPVDIALEALKDPTYQNPMAVVAMMKTLEILGVESEQDVLNMLGLGGP
eukprot:gnl/TRDRNA2_/TRDRNA2_162900_c0_seq5.p1 gnl/TRDRNA2_/TRDRNA2_162900_c0~~gnl/TRDRNA2_/TRDRNA2_162900_c0_seq5.p1  ORF type:complete len:339 (-),score=57.49 gnl/TRDRNA2_/TRDRNA2_162900_c0_seq5:83-949(-)